MMMSTIFFAFLGGLMVALAGMMVYNYMTQESTNLMDRGCPEDLRMCPDGSSVVRVAPDCNFAPCPVSSEEEQLVMCTMDAKICPDGTGVGRVGPNCEFAPCPEEEESEDSIELRTEGGWNYLSSYLIYRNGKIHHQTRTITNSENKEVTVPLDQVNSIFSKAEALWNEPDVQIDKSAMAADGSYSVVILIKNGQEKILQVPDYRVAGNAKAGEFNTFVKSIVESSNVMCTQEVKQCPGGKYVGRDPTNNCEFKPC